MIDKEKQIHWNSTEYQHVFEQIDLFKEIHNTYPDYRSEKDLQFIQFKLDKKRFKSSMNPQFIYKLQTKYSEYRNNLNKIPEPIKEETPEIVEDKITPAEDQKLVDLSVDHFTKFLDSKFLNLYNSVSSLFKEEKVFTDTPTPIIEASLDVKPVPETASSEDVPRLFTSAEIREIIRQEIESIFGPITNEKESTNKVEVVKKEEKTSTTLFNKLDVKNENSLIVSGKEKKSLQNKKIFIFGLNTQQLEKVQNSFENILVRGSTTMNQSAKDVAKNSDFVLVSRFSSHAGLETLKSVCYPAKVEFISGGLSMISRKIDDYIKD